MPSVSRGSPPPIRPTFLGTPWASSDSPAWTELLATKDIVVATASESGSERFSLAPDAALRAFLREQAAQAGVAQQNVIVVTEFYSALVQQYLAAVVDGHLTDELRAAAERERAGVSWFVTSLMESAQVNRRDAQLEHAVQLAHVAARASAALLGAEQRVSMRAARLHADLLREKGALVDARRIYEQTLALQQRVLGAEHDDALGTMTELAATLDTLEMSGAARKLAEQVVEMRMRLWGANDRRTVTSKACLARILANSGELKAALPLYEELLVTCVDLFGAEHNETLLIKRALATVLQRAGELDRAEELFEEVYLTRERLYGVEHPETIAAKFNLANVLNSNDDPARAQRLLEQVRATRERVLGPTHPDTVLSTHDLGVIYLQRGDTASARAAFEEVLAVHDADPKLVRTATAHLERVDNIDEQLQALPHLEGVVEMRERTLGAEHEKTIEAKKSLAVAASRVHDNERALRLFDEILHVQVRTLGADSRAALLTKSNMAVTMFYAGHSSEALETAEDVVERCVAAFGVGNRITLEAKHNLVAILLQRKQVDKALALLNEMLQDCIRELGPAHEFTAAMRLDISKLQDKALNRK